MATPVQDREIGLIRSEDPKTGERFSKYDPAIAMQIVERVAAGDTLKKITVRHGGFPHISTVRRWLAQYPEFKKAYDAARELSSYAMEEEALDHARSVALSPGNSERIRAGQLLIDQLRWSASRRNPKDFSDKGQLSMIVPINITTSLDMGASNVAQAQDVYKLSFPGKVEEAEFTEVPQEGQREEQEDERVDEPAAVLDDAKPLLARPKPSTRKRVLKPRVPLDGETKINWQARAKELARMRERKREREQGAK